MERYITRAQSIAQNARVIGKQVGSHTADKWKEIVTPGYVYETASVEKASEIRQCLDSKFDKEKIDGLKKLIAMISKGKNVLEFFPDVVKNVAASSIDVRKLVYIYLLRYAEKEPDLALLSINTFQKDLGDRNPLIRAMALRVMSSIRVPVIVPLIMLALRKAMTDLSPYVRKTAANAITKCHGLDVTLKDQLVECISQLLTDNSTVVLGSVISSFNQVCPERLDLLHIHFRKLCRLLIDTDDWGQIEVIGLLIRYCRTQFLNPNFESESKQPSPAENKDKAFYSDDEDAGSTSSSKAMKTTPSNLSSLDPDLALFLRACATLTNSCNPSVVMMVSQAYIALAPRPELGRIAKSLIRLVRIAQREQKFVILTSVATLSRSHPDLFRPYYKSFFVYASDPVFIRNLKLEILASLTDQAISSAVLKELKDYVRSHNKGLVVQTIQIMGRIASAVPELADETLRVLMALISSDNEHVVSEAVVVTRRLLQLRPTHESSNQVISDLARALDSISCSAARASILWLVGQYCAQVPLVAPDTLRKTAKSFTSEADSVKLQVLNLELARFDVSFDVRDRARFIKALVVEVPKSESSELGRGLLDIILCAKVHPVAECLYAENERFTIGTLSHSLGILTRGYADLPSWAITQPDPSVRDVMDDGWSRDRVVGSPERDLRKSKKAIPPRANTLDEFYNESESEESSEGTLEKDEDSDSEEDSEDDEEEEEEEYEVESNLLRA
ncbi:hypothetical protein SeMB42_g02568 [Synchytrium endobioticum]|uniref:Clathrin/coatomer adaptor adaptin-like N-terminal domain-containing protein n=1 Tax=Synchytrium endobioticum TaxID=286115 RepID=A0A507DF92_9FUNG|nr:hypothetical protein SeMB42_g02568 [Synchytrium endobioticum]